MGIWEYVLGALLMVVSIALVIIILFQKERASTSKNAFEADNGDSYYKKNSGRTKQAFMGKLTRVLGVALFVIAIAINLFILGPKTKAAASSSEATSSEASVVWVSDESAVSYATESETASGASSETTTSETTVSEATSEVSSEADTSSQG